MNAFYPTQEMSRKNTNNIRQPQSCNKERKKKEKCVILNGLSHKI